MGTIPERLNRNYRRTTDKQWFRIKEIDRTSIIYLVRNLEFFEKDRAIQEGLKAAGEEFKAAGKRRLKQRMKSGTQGVTGNLLRSFQVRVKKHKPGMLVGFKQGKGGGSHAHLVDRGTDERFYVTKTGNRKSVGSMKPNYFWSDTEAQDYPKAMERLYEGIERSVNRINNRR